MRHPRRNGTAGSGGGVLNTEGTLELLETTVASKEANRAGGSVEPVGGSTDISALVIAGQFHRRGQIPAMAVVLCLRQVTRAGQHRRRGRQRQRGGIETAGDATAQLEIFGSDVTSNVASNNPGNEGYPRRRHGHSGARSRVLDQGISITGNRSGDGANPMNATDDAGPGEGGGV